MNQEQNKSKKQREPLTGFTKEDVLRVAELARLSLASEEIDTMRDELSAILAFISKLQEVDIRHVEPTSHGGGLDNALRADTRDDVTNEEEVRAKNIRGAFPVSQNDMLKVPPVLNQDES